MEFLAYVHMALAYEKSLQSKSNSEEFVCQKPVKKWIFAYQNLLVLKLFGWLHNKESKKIANN